MISDSVIAKLEKSATSLSRVGKTEAAVALKAIQVILQEDNQTIECDLSTLDNVAAYEQIRQTVDGLLAPLSDKSERDAVQNSYYLGYQDALLRIRCLLDEFLDSEEETAVK